MPGGPSAQEQEGHPAADGAAHHENLPVLSGCPPAAPAPSTNDDVSEQMARINRSYQATQSMLTAGYNSTLNVMAAMGNMSGNRYRVR
jgi:hypothetical protein